jgi:hypothetical protein
MALQADFPRGLSKSGVRRRWRHLFLTCSMRPESRAGDIFSDETKLSGSCDMAATIIGYCFRVPDAALYRNIFSGENDAENLLNYLLTVI